MTIHQWRILGLLIGISAYGALAMDMYLPALPTLARDFRVATADAQFTMGIFFLGLALSQSVYGPLADRFGRKIPLCGGLILFAAANVGAALAPNFEILLGMRFLQALGASAGTVIARAIIRDTFQGRDAAQAYSVTMTVFMFVPMLAPIAGSYILMFSGWRAIFWILSGLALLAALLTALSLPETYPASRRQPAPLSRLFHTYFDLLKDRRYLGYAISAGFTAGVFFSYLTGSPHLIIDVFGFSPQEYSLIFAANALSIVLGTLVFRHFTKQHTVPRVLHFTYLFHAGAGVLLLLASLTGNSLLTIVCLFFFIGSYGAVAPANVALAMENQPHRAGAASSLFGTMQFVFATVISAVLGAVTSLSAVPLAAVIAAGGICGFLANRFAVDSSPPPEKE